jgi:hypothetical protein
MQTMRALKISDPSVIVLGLQDEIRRSGEARYDHRLHGVLLVAQGMNCCRVAELLGDAPRTVEYWVRRFEEKGLAGLQEGPRPGRPGRMGPGISHRQKVMCPILNGWETFAIIYGRTYSVYSFDKYTGR